MYTTSTVQTYNTSTVYTLTATLKHTMIEHFKNNPKIQCLWSHTQTTQPPHTHTQACKHARKHARMHTQKQSLWLPVVWSHLHTQ